MDKNEKNIYQSIKIFDLDLFSSSKEYLLNYLRNHLEEQKGLLTVMTPNPEQIVVSRNNHLFLNHLQSADLLIPDGVGVVIASKWIKASDKNQSLKERISGREVAEYLLKLTAQKELSVLVIGGRQYIPSPTSVKAVHQLPTPYEHTLWMEGYVDIQKPTNEEESAVVSAIKEIKPAIIFVALGAPYQERWLIEHRELLNGSGVKIGMVVGGAFDILLGKIPQAPAFMQALGLEWLFRLWQEPWRWRRQLKLLEFIKIALQST